MASNNNVPVIRKFHSVWTSKSTKLVVLKSFLGFLLRITSERKRLDSMMMIACAPTKDVDTVPKESEKI